MGRFTTPARGPAIPNLTNFTHPVSVATGTAPLHMGGPTFGLGTNTPQVGRPNFGPTFHPLPHPQQANNRVAGAASLQASGCFPTQCPPQASTGIASRMPLGPLAGQYADGWTSTTAVAFSGNPASDAQGHSQYGGSAGPVNITASSHGAPGQENEVRHASYSMLLLNATLLAAAQYSRKHQDPAEHC